MIERDLKPIGVTKWRLTHLQSRCKYERSVKFYVNKFAVLYLSSTCDCVKISL